MNAYSVSALPITPLRQVSADPGGGIPQKNFCCIPPNSSVRCVTLVLQLATLLNDAFYPRKNVEKAKDSGPRWGAHSVPPDPLAGFTAVSP